MREACLLLKATTPVAPGEPPAAGVTTVSKGEVNMRRMTVLIALVAMLLAGAGLAEAGWVEGVAAYKAGKLDQAAIEFREVAEKTPEFAGGHFMLGQVLLKQEKNAEALTHLKKAYELDTNNTDYRFSLGQAYLANERWADSVGMLNKIDPSSLDKQKQEAYHQMVAVALDKSGDKPAAMAAMKRLTEASPQDSDAWYRYGTMLFNADQVAKAVEALEKSVSLDGKDARKRGAYAKALVRQARETEGNSKKASYDKAIRAVDALVKEDADYDNLLLLGEVQLGAGEYRDAVASLKRAAAKNSTDFYPDFYLAQAYTLLGQYAEAESAAQSALSKAGSEQHRKMVWRQIGFAKEKMKAYAEAREAYTKAGDSAGVRRVSENQAIAQENQSIEKENAQIEQMEAERRRLEEELKELGGPPRR